MNFPCYSQNHLYYWHCSIRNEHRKFHDLHGFVDVPAEMAHLLCNLFLLQNHHHISIFLSPMTFLSPVPDQESIILAIEKRMEWHLNCDLSCLEGGKDCVSFFFSNFPHWAIFLLLQKLYQLLQSWYLILLLLPLFCCCCCDIYICKFIADSGVSSLC